MQQIKVFKNCTCTDYILREHANKKVIFYCVFYVMSYSFFLFIFLSPLDARIKLVIGPRQIVKVESFSDCTLSMFIIIWNESSLKYKYLVLKDPHWLALVICTSCGALDGTRNSLMGPPWGIDPTTHRTMIRRSTTELHLVPGIGQRQMPNPPQNVKI